MTGPPAEHLQWLYSTLEAAYAETGTLKWTWGVTHGWPAEHRFEILVGAVLTQNTAWRNVERALANLRARDALSARAIAAMPHERLAETIRPAGYYRTKATYLKNLAGRLESAGGFQALARRSTAELRADLLGVKGVGPETADAILLYAFERPVFVVDAYARRLLQRLGWPGGDASYDGLRGVFEAALPASVQVLARCHALIVAHAKAVCRSRPLCGQCVLQPHCVFGRDARAP